MPGAMALQSLLQDLSLQQPLPAVEVSGLSLDSRSLRPGELFLAVQGHAGHGLDWADAAIEAGCAAIAWEPADAVDQARADALAARVPMVAVPELSRHASALADRFFERPSSRLRVIGVTGTNGKSSCVEFLAGALHSSGLRSGTLGTLGSGLVGEARSPSNLTTSDAVTFQRELADLREAGAEFALVEVSSHALEQGRVNSVRFEAAVFTNLSRDHLDYHGTMARYAASKARLFAFPGLKFAIINSDDQHGRTMHEAVGPTTKVISFGFENGDLRASDICYGDHGTTYRLHLASASAEVASPLLGQFNVYNQLAVAACLRALDWPLADIVEGLQNLTPPPGRMERLGGRDQLLVVIDYAHTPDALSAALGALRDHVRGRLVCVFGCGGDRDAGKRPMMGAIAEKLSDAVVLTDDNPRGEDPDKIIREILGGVQRPEVITVIRDRARAIAHAIADAGREDSVLIAGKGHENYQEIDGQRRPFSDREVAAGLLEAAA